jgi:hypothetical protein
MATFTKNPLSGSTNGKQIKISATASGGANTIHTAVSGTAAWDEIWIYAYNDDTVVRNLVVLFGGTTEPDNKILIPIQPQSGRTLVVDGMLLQNSLVVKAYASQTNVVIVDGYVNSIT